MTPANGRFRLRLAKEDFKFSAAHFTLFGRRQAEPLHGHNYRVEVEVEGVGLDELGLLAPVGALKSEIRAACAGLDDRVLLPGDSPWVEISHQGETCTARFDDREYRFPRSEVRVLPLVNTTMELFARLLWAALASSPTLAARSSIDHLAVTVEETGGQSCRFEAPLRPPAPRDA